MTPNTDDSFLQGYSSPILSQENPEAILGPDSFAENFPTFSEAALYHPAQGEITPKILSLKKLQIYITFFCNWLIIPGQQVLLELWGVFMP